MLKDTVKHPTSLLLTSCFHLVCALGRNEVAWRSMSHCITLPFLANNESDEVIVAVAVAGAAVVAASSSSSSSTTSNGND